MEEYVKGFRRTTYSFGKMAGTFESIRLIILSCVVVFCIDELRTLKKYSSLATRSVKSETTLFDLCNNEALFVQFFRNKDNNRNICANPKYMLSDCLFSVLNKVLHKKESLRKGVSF